MWRAATRDVKRDETQVVRAKWSAPKKGVKPSCPSRVPDTHNSHVRVVVAVSLLTAETAATVP